MPGSCARWDDYRDVRRLGRKTRSPGAAAGESCGRSSSGSASGSTQEDMLTEFGMFTRLSELRR